MFGVEVRGQRTLFGVEDSLDELERLADTAGVKVVGRDVQRLSAVHPGTFIGSGKVQELKLQAHELDLDMVIFDDELSPAQLRNLERELEIKIVDRTALILDIFALHARTREGALQVELAQYAYRLPRLTRQWTHLSRQAVGGVGLRGPGETQLEVDRREIGRRMARLREELDRVRQQRSQQRRRRRREGMPVVAIVGYTNAGKSTLLNALTNAQVLAENRLFATLDPTTRRVDLPGGKVVLFTDTVGFIQKLPTQLVAAFRATLEEVHEADVLLHIVDVSDHNALEQVITVESVLQEIGAADKTTIVALNKIDLIDPETQLEAEPGPFVVRRDLMTELGERYQHVIPISAEQNVGLEDLLQAVEDTLVDQMEEVDTVLPYSAGELLSLWHAQGVIDSESYQQKGIRVKGKLPRWLVPLIENGG
ncbi:MAG: GTPase HflX [Anaerolineae bacterium]